ncbi:MAG: CHAT domain-containing protein [Okeania sp. SIO2B3]|nr:CHAT domain-containing protein [Okeania sp. SIO2B3]
MMNSAGIIFGANARLDIPASFVVTTGSGIGFDSGWFNSIGENNYDILTGNPSAFSFPMTSPGVILNRGELTVEAGESVTLLGGTIINTGKISAPGGEITISTVPGENLVRISQEGRLLNLEIATEDGGISNDLSEELHSLNPLSIPELLTGNSEVMEIATGVRVNDNNEVVLTGSNQVIPTDLGTTIISGSLDISLAENSEFSNTSKINIFGEKVGLFNAKLNASGLYGSGNIRIGGDSEGLGTVPNAIRTYVDEKTEIYATSFRGEGGNVVIWSDEETSFFGKIEALGRREEQATSAEQNSSKNLVEVSSQGNLIFDGTVNLGSPDVLGSLSFKAENINIVDANIDVADNPLRGETAIESQISKSSIESISDSTNITFQASDNITINNLSETQLNFAQTKGEISFVADSDENGLGSLTIDSENTINTQGATVNISGTTINTGDINTAGGELNITSSQGFVMTNNLSTANSNTTAESNGGEINVQAQGDITTGEIDASGDFRGGNITMNAATNIDTQSIHAEGTQSGGNIDITAQGDITTGEIDASGDSRGGNITINAVTDIDTESIDAEGRQSGGNIDIRAGNTLNLRGISTSSGSRETGNITITGDEINLLGGENSVSSNGRLILQPASENQNITLGGFENIEGTDGNLPLHLTTGDLATLANGFESVTIGNSENSGNITIASTESSNTNGVVFNDPTTIQAETITGTGTITGVDNAQITINANSDISTGNISTSTGVSITSIQGNIQTGDVTANTSDNSISNIEITSSGSIETGKITTTGTTAGGNINLQAGDRITIGRINSSATPGNAGEVKLNAENGIEVISIQAEGGNSGGNVEITTGDTLRIRGTFLDQNQNIASISTAGEIVGGNIAISTGNTPFIVGDATINGSVGAITDGKSTVLPDRSLPSSFELKEVESSQPQNSESDETTSESTETTSESNETTSESTETTSESTESTTASETQENQPQPEESTTQNVTQPESTESSNSEENQTTTVTETQPELVEEPKNIEEPQTQIPPEVDNEEPSNTNQDIQIVSPNPNDESNSPVLDNSEPTTPIAENIAPSVSSIEEPITPIAENTASSVSSIEQPTTPIAENITSSVSSIEQPTTPIAENIASSMSSSGEQIIPLVVENQNQTTLEFEQPNNSQLMIAENVETNILVEDTNSSSIPSVLEPTVAIENPAQGKSSQKPTPTIVVEESITTTTSEISRNDNYNQISLTDTLSQIELNRGREFAGYFGKNITKKTVTAANIRNTLSSVEKIGIRPAIIYVSAQPNNLELQLFLPNGKPIVRSSGNTRDEVIEVAKKFTNQIRTPSQLNSHHYLPNAQKLYQWLIAPIAEELANHNINTIVFSMDSGLRTIPIAALHDGQQFLVEQYSLGLIPSFTLTDTTYVGLNGSQVLAMGASEFPGNTEQTPLPAVPVELKTIVNNLWPGQSFLNQGFTLENLKQQSSKEKFKIIHLATHGEFHPGGADNSYIQLWDTKLRLNQLRQLRLYNAQVELLVLSACTTAVGDEEAELGFAGLAVQAGVKSALASLWYVSDTGTLALMTEFYQNLSNRPIKAAALRQAQLAMLRGEVHLQDGHILRNGNQHLPLPRELARGGRRDLSHPYYWAAFTMIGSPW